MLCLASPGVAGVVTVVLQQDILQAEAQVDGGDLPVGEGEEHGPPTESRALHPPPPPPSLLGLEDSLSLARVHRPPGAERGVEGEVVREGAVEAHTAALLQHGDVRGVSGGPGALPHCQHHLVRAPHGPVRPGEVTHVHSAVT